MPMIAPLTAPELAEALEKLHHWRHDFERRALHRQLTFSTFAEALAAMVQIGMEADKRDHHPEWSNVYGTIDIWLTTHDAGGISTRDTALAAAIDQMFQAPPKIGPEA
jgi:4a-hydroxytetrahydrobiopterin dehydratase